MNFRACQACGYALTADARKCLFCDAPQPRPGARLIVAVALVCAGAAGAWYEAPALKQSWAAAQESFRSRQVSAVPAPIAETATAPSDSPPAAPVEPLGSIAAAPAPEPQREPAPAEPAAEAREMETVAALSAPSANGKVQIPSGSRVTIVEDRGPTVMATFEGATVQLPRTGLRAVAAATAAVEPPSVAMLKTAQPIAADALPPATTLGIDVKEIGTGKGIDHKWETDYGSYSRDYFRTKGLDVNVRNVSRAGAGACEVGVYWLSQGVADKQVHIHHGEVMPIEVGAASSISRQFWCPLLKANVTHYEIINRTNVSGAKFFGWMVLVSREGEILAAKGSSAAQEQLIKSPDLKRVLTEYTPSGAQATATMPHWRTDPARNKSGVSSSR